MAPDPSNLPDPLPLPQSEWREPEGALIPPDGGGPAGLIHPDDPDDDWLAPDQSGRVVRVRVVTGALVLLAVLGGGFWGGVVAEKHHGPGSSSTASALASRLSALRAGATGAGGATGTGTGTGSRSGFNFAGGGRNATIGTVIDVQGNTVDISSSSGNIVKITVGPSTTITRTVQSSAAGLQVGDTVVVTGAAGTGGAVKATAIRATAQGLSATGGAGGFGGFTPPGG